VPGGEVLLLPSLAVDAANLGVEATLTAEGQGSALQLVFDGAAVATDGTAFLGAGADAADAAARGLQDDTNTAFDALNTAATRGDDSGDFDALSSNFSNALDAQEKQSSQTLASLFTQGLRHPISPNALSDGLHDLNPVNDARDLFTNYSTLGASDFSSSASVLAHRISTLGAPAGFAVGVVDDHLEAQPPGG
jgi:uncharacterized protein (DUF885 family)